MNLMHYKDAIDDYIARFSDSQRLYINKYQESLFYTLKNGGKRLRALLLFGVIQTKRKITLEDFEIALAIEMMHAYSLIHDDLPAMDNALYRRKKLANHIVYGEDLAILSGDGLNTNVFYTIANTKLPSWQIVEIIKILSKATGFYGMALGQAADVLSSKDGCNKNQKWLVNFIHKNKTAKFIQAVSEVGALLSGADIKIFSKFGLYLGMAFQIIDDVLDLTADINQLGKDKKDERNNTLTFPRVYGPQKSILLANRLKQLAIMLISNIENCEDLIELANFVLDRKQ